MCCEAPPSADRARAALRDAGLLPGGEALPELALRQVPRHRHLLRLPGVRRAGPRAPDPVQPTPATNEHE